MSNGITNNGNCGEDNPLQITEFIDSLESVDILRFADGMLNDESFNDFVNNLVTDDNVTETNGQDHGFVPDTNLVLGEENDFQLNQNYWSQLPSSTNMHEFDMIHNNYGSLFSIEQSDMPKTMEYFDSCMMNNNDQSDEIKSELEIDTNLTNQPFDMIVDNPNNLILHENTTNNALKNENLYTNYTIKAMGDGTERYDLVIENVPTPKTSLVFIADPRFFRDPDETVIENPQVKVKRQKRKDKLVPIEVYENENENVKPRCLKYSHYDPYPENPDLIELDAIFTRKTENVVPPQMNKVKKVAKTETRTESRQPSYERNTIEKRIEHDYESTTRIPFYSSFIESIRVKDNQQNSYSYGRYVTVKRECIMKRSSCSKCRKLFMDPKYVNAHEKYCNLIKNY